MLRSVGHRLSSKKPLEKCGIELQICPVGVVFARIPQRLLPCLCGRPPIGQEFSDFAKCGVRQQSLTRGKARQVAGRIAILGLKKDSRQTTGGGDSQYAAEYSDDSRGASQIVLRSEERRVGG